MCTPPDRYSITNTRLDKDAKCGHRQPCKTKDDCLYSEDFYAGSFSKGLEHSETTGELTNPCAYKNLVNALCNEDMCALSKVALAPQGKLVVPGISLTKNLLGAHPSVFGCCVIPKAPCLTSEIKVAEYSELLLRAAVRDVDFGDYDTNPTVMSAINAINTATPEQREFIYHTPYPVTADTIFRGSFPGERKGGLISRFLLDPITENGNTMTQDYTFPAAGSTANNFMTTIPTASSAQNGIVSDTTTLGPTRTITTFRDLAEYVHSDPPIWAYENAAMIMSSKNVPPNPYLVTLKRDALGGGIVDRMAAMGETLRICISTAWYFKWRVNRALRPEAYGIILARELPKVTGYGKNGKFLLPNSILDSTFLNTSIGILDGIDPTITKGILPQTFPEGSPQHPSYPAGHAVVAGGMASILKAFFDTSGEYASAGSGITYSDEIDKLAANIAYGRNAAGVHYASDGYYGILLGEAVACQYLSELITTFPERYSFADPNFPLKFKGFKGNDITIRPFKDKEPKFLMIVLLVIFVGVLILAAVYANRQPISKRIVSKSGSKR